MARRVVVSELLSARRVATYGSVRGKELRRLLAQLTKNTAPDAPVDLSECFLNLANDVLCRVAFGRRFPHGGKDDKRAIIKETFRLHPAVPLLVPRESVADSTLGGYHIPAKTRIFINTFAMGRDPEIWENPLEYSPERFEGAGGEIDLKDPDYKLLPFGGGRRGCPGYTFALASLLYHFEWALPGGVRAEDVSLEESFGLATRKKEPLFVAVRKSDAYAFKGEELNEV